MNSISEARDIINRPTPTGWCWVTLKEVCRVFAGAAAPQGQQYFNNDGPFFFRVSDLGRHGRTISLTEAERPIVGGGVRKLQTCVCKVRYCFYFLKVVLLLLLTTRAMLTVDGFIVSHLMALEPKGDILSEWLYYVSCEIDMMDYSGNSGYPSLKQSVVEGIEIPLPPLAEQLRIVAMLKEHMAALDKAKAAAQEQLDAINALPSAFLRLAFNGGF